MTIRRRRHYGLQSMGYICLTALLAVGAVNSQNNLLFFVFGLSLAALIISGVISGVMIVRVRVRREPVGAAQVGEPLRIEYEITNASRFVPAFALTIRERARPRARGQAASPDAIRPNWPRFMPEPSAFAPHVPARAAVHAVGVVIPTRRGVATFHALRIETAFPFGIIRKSALFVPADSERSAPVIIRPRLAPLSHGALRQFTVAAHEGEPAPNAIGRADEFFGLRNYTPGDTLRRIAWKASARTGELVVRENISHAPSRLWVILAPRASRDPVASPDEIDREDEHAVSLAAGVIAEAERSATAVGLVAPLISLDSGHDAPSEVVRIAPRLGHAHTERLFDALALADMRPRDPAPLTPDDAGSPCIYIRPGGAPSASPAPQPPRPTPAGAAAVGAGA